jgi:hypothetical protein
MRRDDLEAGGHPRERDEDAHIGRLLGGRPRDPSVLEKEAAFAAIADSVQAAPSSPRPRMLWGAATLAAAAAALLALWPRSQPDAWTARGSAPLTHVALVCVRDNRPSPCTQAASLRFEVHAAAATQHLAAFARDPEGTILWYFPAADARTSPLGPLPANGLLEQVVRLSTQHMPGRYEVFVVLSPNALTRSELKQRLGPELRGDADLQVFRLPMTVEAAP